MNCGSIGYDYWAEVGRKPATLGYLVSRILDDKGYLRRDDSDGEIVFTIPRYGKIALRGRFPDDPAYILTLMPRGFPIARIVERNCQSLREILEKDEGEGTIKLRRVVRNE